MTSKDLSEEFLKKQKLQVPSEKCVVVMDSEDLKIFSVELTYRHNSVFVVQAEGNFVCHSDKCIEKRAVHMASDVSFACDQTKLVKSYCHPTSAKNLTEEDIITVEPRLSGLVGTSVKSPDNRESG